MGSQTVFHSLTILLTHGFILFSSILRLTTPNGVIEFEDRRTALVLLKNQQTFGWIKDDETPWCGTSLAYAAVEMGVAERNTGMPRAFWWLNWGTAVTVLM